MKLTEVLEYHQKGYPIRRKSWPADTKLELSGSMMLASSDLLAKDWEVEMAKFTDALYAVLSGRCVHRLSSCDKNRNSICYRSGGVFMGLGTANAHPYQFTDEEVLARDWVIEG